MLTWQNAVESIFKVVLFPLSTLMVMYHLWRKFLERHVFIYTMQLMCCTLS